MSTPYYNMYSNESKKICGCFAYKKELYYSGTKFIFTGFCFCNKERIFLSQAAVTYMYNKENYEYFKDDDNKVYMCHFVNFHKCIDCIVKEDLIVTEKQDKTEFYWGDGDVTKTLWYVLIMLFATIFNERIWIWILATIVWYCSIFKKK